MNGLAPGVGKMRSEGVADAALETFRRYYERLREGELGALPEADLEPIEDLQAAEELPRDEGDASEALDRAVVLKLNGGLGTSMGVDAPRSLLQLLPDFEARFPAGPPSLEARDRLTVIGDVVFGRDVVVGGSVTIEQEQLRLADSTVLEG